VDRMRNLPRSFHCEKRCETQREAQPPEFNQSRARAITGSSNLVDWYKPEGAPWASGRTVRLRYGSLAVHEGHVALGPRQEYGVSHFAEAPPTPVNEKQ